MANFVAPLPVKREDCDNSQEVECAFAEAMQAFQTTMLTGRRPLSDEEKAEIQSRIEYFLAEYDIDTDEEFKLFKMFLRGLALEFGRSSDFTKFIEELVYEKTELEIEMIDLFAQAPKGEDIHIVSSAQPDEDEEEPIAAFMRAKIGSNPNLQRHLNGMKLSIAPQV